jgi:hypothetical protein
MLSRNATQLSAYAYNPTDATLLDSRGYLRHFALHCKSVENLPGILGISLGIRKTSPSEALLRMG